MKRAFLLMLVVCCFFGLLFQSGCKTSEDVQYTLAVTVGSGITGTPATGSYSYADGDVVNYSYSLQAGYENLEVKLDGIVVGNSGVITMNMGHTLTVTAEEIFNPTGEWEGIAVYTSADLRLRATFDGGWYSGTLIGNFASIGENAGGQYSISGTDISFNMNFSAGNIYFRGTIEDDDTMTGNWRIGGAGGPEGRWRLTRQ